MVGSGCAGCRATVIQMKRALLFILVALAMVMVACEVSVPTPTAAPVATSTSVPTPTSKLLPTATPTPDPAPPDALSIVRAAEENLRSVSSFHIVVEDNHYLGVTGQKIEGDIVPLDRGYFIEYSTNGLVSYNIEYLLIGEARYVRYPDFRVWFDVGEERPSHWDLRRFPYDLTGLGEEVVGLEVLGEEMLDGIASFHLKGTGMQKLKEEMGFRPVAGFPEVELWISRVDLLPLRIETQFEEINGGFSAVYSDFGAEVDLPVPKEVLDQDYLRRLPYGPLSQGEMVRLLRAVPVEGQKCMEAEIGTDLYREVLSGDSDADIVLGIAFTHCRNEILSRTSDLFFNGIAETLYELDLTVLSIQPEQMVKEVVECLREGIGLESLFEIGSLPEDEGERAPTPDELEAAERCKAVGEG